MRVKKKLLETKMSSFTFHFAKGCIYVQDALILYSFLVVHPTVLKEKLLSEAHEIVTLSLFVVT